MLSKIFAKFGSNFAKMIEIFVFEPIFEWNFAKEIERKFGNPNHGMKSQKKNKPHIEVVVVRLPCKRVKVVLCFELIV